MIDLRIRIKQVIASRKPAFSFDIAGRYAEHATANGGNQEFFTNFPGDLGTPFNAVRTEQITIAQKARFDQFIGKGSNTNWTIFKNCSYFSTKAFNYTTGLNLMAHPFMVPIYTPSWLVRTIH